MKRPQKLKLNEKFKEKQDQLHNTTNKNTLKYNKQFYTYICTFNTLKNV